MFSWLHQSPRYTTLTADSSTHNSDTVEDDDTCRDGLSDHKSLWHRWQEIMKNTVPFTSHAASVLACVLLVVDLSWRGCFASDLREEYSSDQHLLRLNTSSTYLGKEFSSDHRYMTLDHNSDALWSLPGAATLIRLPNESDHGKPVLASISMLHQLHCLASIRRALQEASEGVDIGIDWNDDDHWPHCFNYLRESILCAADGTVERPRLINGTRVAIGSTEGIAIDGTGFARTCRDSELLYKYQSQHGPILHKTGE